MLENEWLYMCFTPSEEMERNWSFWGKNQPSVPGYVLSVNNRLAFRSLHALLAKVFGKKVDARWCWPSIKVTAYFERCFHLSASNSVNTRRIPANLIYHWKAYKILSK